MGFGVVREEEEESDIGFTVVWPIVLHSLSLFLLLLAILSIEWGDLLVGYMRERERDTQVIGPNLNKLGNIQWVGLLGLITI